MSAAVNVHAAEANFSKLLEKVIAGEEITIVKAGKPVAKLSPIKPEVRKKRVPGIDKGKIWMSPDFNVMSEAESEQWAAGGPRSASRTR